MASSLRRTPILAAAALTLLAGTAAPMQARQPPPQPKEPVLMQVQRIISINFPGGTVADYIDAIRQSLGGEPLNVLLPAEAASMTIGPVSLFNVSVGAAMDSLESIASNDSVKLSIKGIANAGSSIWSVQRTSIAPTGPFGDPKAGDQIAIISLNDLVSPPWAKSKSEGGVPPETILSAVEAAMKSIPSQTTPSIKFHKDSGVLILVGSPAQRQAGTAVVTSLQHDVARRPDASGQKQAMVTVATVFVSGERAAKAVREVYLLDSTAPDKSLKVELDPNNNRSVVLTGPRDSVIGAEAVIRSIDSARTVENEATLAGAQEAAKKSRTQIETLQHFNGEASSKLERALQEIGDLRRAKASLEEDLAKVQIELADYRNRLRQPKPQPKDEPK